MKCSIMLGPHGTKIRILTRSKEEQGGVLDPRQALLVIVTSISPWA